MQVPTPRFVDLYIEQLLSPLVIFQVLTPSLPFAPLSTPSLPFPHLRSTFHTFAPFSHLRCAVTFQLFTSALWLLDAVSIGFTAFQVFTILLLESTSVFQVMAISRMRAISRASPMQSPHTPAAGDDNLCLRELHDELLTNMMSNSGPGACISSACRVHAISRASSIPSLTFHAFL